jgi:hypothetical protein
MLKFFNNASGFMGLTLTTLGLFIASSMLLVIVCFLVVSNPWQETETLHAIARSITTRIQDMDAQFYESTILYQPPPSKFQYTIQVSTEYLTVCAKNSWGQTLCVRERFIIRAWPRNNTMTWTTGEDLHRFVNETYGHCGTQEDPLPYANLSELENEQEDCATLLALHPLRLWSGTPLCIERVSLFDDTGDRYDLILLYQIE